MNAELGHDSTGGSLGGIGAQIGLRHDDVLAVRASSSRSPDAAHGDAVTRSLSAGYTFHGTARFSFTPGLEVWGARSDLATRSLLFDATVNLKDWSFGLQPELKSLIWATTKATPSGRKKARSGAVGAHVHAEFLGLESWVFQLRVGGLNYGGERFDSFYYSSLVTSSSVERSQGLVKGYGALLVSYHLSPLTFIATGQRTTYLVGDYKTTSGGLEVDWDVSSRWTVGAAFSSSQGDHSASSIQTSSVVAIYNW